MYLPPVYTNSVKNAILFDKESAYKLLAAQKAWYPSLPMIFVPLEEALPTLRDEIRCLHLHRDGDEVPSGVYAFVELFCSEKDCDCRRAFINVVAVDGPWKGRHLATIGYGWEEESFYIDWMYGDEEARGMSGARLEPMQVQSESAPFFLMWFHRLLEDKVYRRRIMRHYELFRQEMRKKKAHDEDDELGLPGDGSSNRLRRDGLLRKAAEKFSALVRRHGTTDEAAVSSALLPFGLSSFEEASRQWTAYLHDDEARKIPAVHDVGAVVNLLREQGNFSFPNQMLDEADALSIREHLRTPHAKRTLVPEGMPLPEIFASHAERTAHRIGFLLQALDLVRVSDGRLIPAAGASEFLSLPPVDQYCAILWAYLVELPWERLPILHADGDISFLDEDGKEQAEILLRDFLRRAAVSGGGWVSMSWFADPPSGDLEQPMSDPIPFAMEAEYFLWEPFNWLGLVKPWIFHRGEAESISDARLTSVGARILPTLLPAPVLS
jgi:hypothetical protein